MLNMKSLSPTVKKLKQWLKFTTDRVRTKAIYPRSINMFVYHYAHGNNKVRKAIFSAKVTVKVTWLLGYSSSTNTFFFLIQ